MNNSKNSASPTIQKASQETKQGNSSYWLTQEEIKALHEDAQQSMELIRHLRKKKGYVIQ